MSDPMQSAPAAPDSIAAMRCLAPWRHIPQRLSWRRGALHVWTLPESDPAAEPGA